ncbi:AfsR/SARP family transcriptional regulator [Glycomyces buryatensis]|uniref:AfsR/SARP family transcriptional regulator n=1 Tax=Glycomyces buryatensis TaxID=2570927 RepID=UPI001B3C1708|nr:BTAD domain-containing putative transcriptional regulator [Glycomyces buryatensis]
MALTTGRRRSLLAVLAMSGGRTVPVDQLASAVFGEGLPANARRSVQTYLARLRRAIGDRWINTEAAGVMLQVDPDAVDAIRFEHLLDRAARHRDGDEERDLLCRALSLWRGDPFDGVASERLELFEAPRLRELFLAGLERRIDLDLAEGRHGELVAELSRLTAEHPLRESLWVRLLAALDGSGRPAEALERYEAIRAMIADELGADPGPELRQAHTDLLAERRPASAGRAELTVTPRQLPVGIDAFTGREAELQTLSGLAEGTADAPAAAVVTGTAGVGKTSLALHWAHRVADRFPDGQLYVDLRGFGPRGQVMEPGEAVRAFLEAFGIAPTRLPSSLDGLVGLYRSLLAGRRVLVVLDNARDGDQVRPLLPTGPGCMALVTSRDRLLGLVAAETARPIGLDLPALAEARLMLAARIGVDRIEADLDAADQIVAHCARLPLALAVAAARAQANPVMSLAALADELRGMEGGLDALDSGDHVADVRRVFSWSYRTLSDEVAGLFRLLSLHPGPDIAVPTAASLAGLPPRQVRRRLSELARAHLLSEFAPGRFAFHDLLRAYAAELATRYESSADRHRAAHRLLDHYVHTSHVATLLVEPGVPEIDIPLGETSQGVIREPLDDREAAMTWFEVEHRAMMATAVQADDDFDVHVWQSAWALQRFFYLRGHWHSQIGILQAALAASQRLGNPAAQAHSHRALAWAHSQLGQLEESGSHLTHALELSALAGDPIGQAAAHNNLGFLAQEQGHLDEALEHSRRALELHRAAGHRLGEANALNSIGWQLALLGEHAKALDFCEQALELCLELDYRSLGAGVCDSLGYIHNGLGNHTEARSQYQSAIDSYREFGDRFNEADTLAHLGDLHHSTGDSDAARKAWQASLDILIDLEHANAADLRAKLDDL